MKTLALIIAVFFFISMLVAVATTNSPFANYVNKKLNRYFGENE